MPNHYDNGFQDGKLDSGTHYPSSVASNLQAFEEYQRGYLDGTLERLKQDGDRLTPLFKEAEYVVRLDQRVTAHISVRVLVKAASKEEAMQKAQDGEGVLRISPIHYEETEEILSEHPRVVPFGDPEWKW